LNYIENVASQSCKILCFDVECFEFQTIVLNQSLQRQSLSAQVPSLIKGEELREKIETFPLLSNIVGHRNGLQDMKNKIRHWGTWKGHSYIIAGAHGTGMAYFIIHCDH